MLLLSEITCSMDSGFDPAQENEAYETQEGVRVNVLYFGRFPMPHGSHDTALCARGCTGVCSAACVALVVCWVLYYDCPWTLVIGLRRTVYSLFFCVSSVVRSFS